VLKLIGALSLAIVVTVANPARSTINDVVVVVSNPAYSGTCPVTLTFTVAMDGDPETIFSQQLVGDWPSATKVGYGYVPPTGSISFNSDVTFDVAHAGQHYIQAKIKFGDKPLGTDLPNTIDSDKVAYSVTCVSASPSPAPRR
jgi:hypothetical protein